MFLCFVGEWGMTDSKLDVRKDIITLFLAALVIFEFLFIAYINLFHIGDTIDEDFSGMLRHTMEIANNNRYFVREWSYPTSGEYDTPLFLAVLIYKITGNIFLAYGIANILNALLIGYCIYRVLAIAVAALRYRLLGIAMVLAAYVFGMLSYNNMMFFGGSQYVYKVLLPLLFLMVFFSARENKKRYIFECVVFYGLFALTSFSSGLYVFLSGIVPIIICGVLFTAMKALPVEIDGITHIVATVLIAAVGVFLHGLAGIESRSFNPNFMTVRHDASFMDALSDVVNSFFDVVNPFAKGTVSATSAEGVSFAIKWGMIVLILSGLLYVPRIFTLNMLRGNGKIASSRDIVSTCMISVFAWNLFILLVTFSKSRYHLIGFIPLILCSVMVLEDTFSGKVQLVENVVLGTIAVMYAFFEIMTCTSFAPSYFRHENITSYYVNERICSEIKALADNYEVNTVVFANTLEMAEIMRFYDPSRRYTTYMGSERRVTNYDYYLLDSDKSVIDDKNMLVVSDDGYNTLKSFIKDNYVDVGRLDELRIMISDDAPMDGGSFVIKGIRTVDLPVSPGYTYSGDIGAKGYLYSGDVGEIMKSAEVKADRGFSYVLNYELSGSKDPGAELVIMVKGKGRHKGKEDVREWGRFPLDPSADSITVDIDTRGEYTFIVNKNGDGVIAVKEMEFVGK